MARHPASARRQAAAGISESVGLQLRARREEAELSLRELARRLGISPSALSQIETGKSRPSVSTLYAIVSELGASLDELFEGAAGLTPPRPAERAAGSERARQQPAAEERVQRPETRSMIQLESGVRWERLTATPDPEADFLYVVYDPGGSSSQADGFIRHAGREYGFIISGALEVTVGFDAYELGPGDSISFDSTTPHRLRNTGTEPVEGIWLVTGRGGDLRTTALSEPSV